MSRNVLVTGGLGFIGGWLVQKLRAKGCRVTALDNLSAQVHGQERRRVCEIETVIGDVRDKAWLLPLVKEHDTIIHLAAETGTGQSMYEIERYTDVNVRGTACLMEAVTKSDKAVKRVIVASSRAVYGEGKYSCRTHGVFYPDGRRNADLASRQFEITCPLCRSVAQSIATDEMAELRPASVYAVTKHAQEELVTTVARAVGISGVVLRLQNVFGPGQSLQNPYTGILSIFANLMRGDEPVNIFEDGRESRDFVYVEDVADAFMAAVEAELPGCHIFNVGSGEARSVVDVASALKEKLGSSSRIEITGDYRIGDIRHNRADISAGMRRLNFVPRHSFDQGLQQFVDWVRTQPRVAGGGYQGALQEMRKQGLLK